MYLQPSKEIHIARVVGRLEDIDHMTPVGRPPMEHDPVALLQCWAIAVRSCGLEALS
jgi:hypothetical protein